MQTTNYQALKISSTLNSKIDDILVVEAPLQININNNPYTVVMRTPDNDLELIRGLLYAEDIYKNSTPVKFEVIKFDNDCPAIINIKIPKKLLGNGYLNKRTLLSVSSCGICGKKELEDLKVDGNKLNTKLHFTAKKLHEMHQKMRDLQITFKKSGGSHAASIFDIHHNLLSLNEDIGRHNAVDKCVGDLLLNNNLEKAKYLLVSGRVSYEIVSKAFIAKIPIIVAISACSSLAVDFAKEFGLCLIGFTRTNKMTVYSNPNFIKL